MGIEITHLTRRGREQGSPTWVGEGGNKRSASTLSQASRPGGEVPCIATCSLCACGAEGGSVDEGAWRSTKHWSSGTRGAAEGGLLQHSGACNFGTVLMTQRARKASASAYRPASPSSRGDLLRRAMACIAFDTTVPFSSARI